MNLLIITQKVDRKDPILGFFHRWLQEFGKRAQVTVIGQSVGDYQLPGVTVLSLEKEKGRSRIGQIFRFWRLIWSHRRAYDVVLVHMTPIWIVLGAKIWLLCCKKMYLWYEARGGGVPLRFASFVCTKIFSASTRGMPIRTKKSVIVGHGIDTDAFRPAIPTQVRKPALLVTVGRITSSKRLEIIIDALTGLPQDARLQIVGLPLTDRDRVYEQQLDQHIREKGLEGRVVRGALTSEKIAPLLQSASVFLHASATALDKALLEAMACGCPVVSCADIAGILPEACRATPDVFAAQVQKMLERTPAERAAVGQQLRAIVERDHGLSRLMDRLVGEMASATL